VTANYKHFQNLHDLEEAALSITGVQNTFGFGLEFAGLFQSLNQRLLYLHFLANMFPTKAVVELCRKLCHVKSTERKPRNLVRVSNP
jgi:hypothetical protein